MLKSLRRKILGDLRANRGQFFAVWLVVTLGTAFYGAMYPAGVNMLNSFYRTYDQLHYMDFEVQLDSAAPGVVEGVRAVPGVAGAEGRLVIESGLQLRPEQRYLITLRMISVPDDRAPTVNQSDITNGHGIQAAHEVLLLKSFADYHGIRPGDTLRVWINGTEVDLVVAGLAFNAEYLIAGSAPTSPFPTPSSFGVAWMRDSELASLAGRRDGEINNVVVRLAGKSSQVKTALENSVRAELESLFGGQPGLAIYSRTQTASGGVVDANINGGFSIAMFFSGVFLLGTLPVTSVLLARMVEGERQRIGTLRALGVTRRELIQHYLAFGLIIGVTGGLTGSVLGYLNSFWVMDTFIRYLAGGTLPGFANHPQLPFILLGFVIVVLGSTFAGAYPAWVQSATPPGIALRPMVPKMPNALSRARLRLLPPVLRRVVRNMLRVPGRSLSTALGVVAGAMMIFSSFALWDTLQSNFKDYFGSSAFDLRIDMSTLQPAGPLEAQVRAIPGVQAAQGALVGPVTILRADGSLFETAAVVIDERDPFFDLRTLDGAPAFSRADGVWIGHNTRRVLGVDAGDTLTLRAFGQERQVQVLGVVSYTLGGPLFIPRGLLVQWTPNAVFPVNAALVRVPAGQAAPMRDALVDLPGMRAVTVLSDYDADVNHYLNWFRAGTLIFGGFGYILTLAVLFNTVNGGLRERHDELAILRALGSSRREIALMVTLELLAMVVLGAVIGVPVGRAMGFWLTHTYDTDFFGQVNVLRPHYYVVGLLSLVIVVLLAELPGLRAVQRADLGQISKSQSF